MTPLEHKEVCRFGDIMGMMPPKVAKSLSTEAVCYNDERVIIARDRLVKNAYCHHHMKQCEIPVPDLNISGPHCCEHSNAGKRQGAEGWSAKFFLAHCKFLKEKAIRMAVLENVAAESFQTMVPLS